MMIGRITLSRAILLAALAIPGCGSSGTVVRVPKAEGRSWGGVASYVLRHNCGVEPTAALLTNAEGKLRQSGEAMVGHPCSRPSECDQRMYDSFYPDIEIALPNPLGIICGSKISSPTPGQGTPITTPAASVDAGPADARPADAGVPASPRDAALPDSPVMEFDGSVGPGERPGHREHRPRREPDAGRPPVVPPTPQTPVLPPI